MRKTETGREKKTDTRRRKIPINLSPVCFKKRERETSAVGVHEGHPLKTQNKRGVQTELLTKILPFYAVRKKEQEVGEKGSERGEH